MLRTLTRRGASVLVAVALLGGGLALGAGSASAQEFPGGVIGSVGDLGAGSVLGAGIASGSIDTADIWTGCPAIQFGCPDPLPTSTEILSAWLRGIPPEIAFPEGEPREYVGS